MEIYLSVITTVLVVTQVIRVTQNALQLRKQNRLIQAQLAEIEDITDEDVKRKITIDKILVDLLPKIAERYGDEING